MKGVARNDDPAENYRPALQLPLSFTEALQHLSAHCFGFYSRRALLFTLTAPISVCFQQELADVFQCREKKKTNSEIYNRQIKGLAGEHSAVLSCLKSRGYFPPELEETKQNKKKRKTYWKNQ